MQKKLPLICIWICAAALTAQAADPSLAPTPEPAGATPAAQPAATPPPLRLAVDLADGSHLIGTPEGDTLQFKTAYVDASLEYREMRAIDFDSTPGHTATAIMHNGDILNGHLSGSGIVLNTCFGRVAIPVNVLQSIRVRHGASAVDRLEGLVLHLDFSASDGEKIADSSGLGNDGVVSGATRIDTGKGGRAMNFDGGDQKIIVKNSQSLQLQDFTFMLWVKRNDVQKTTPSDASTVLIGYGRNGYGFGIMNQGQLCLCKVQVSAVNSTCKITDTEFHHIAVTKKGNKIVFYLDGVAYPGNDFGDSFDFGTDLWLGGIDEASHFTFMGSIREAAVFKRALSDDEIKEIYEAGK